jgi:cation:H+ antiporter
MIANIHLTLGWSIAIFVAAATAIAIGGIALTARAERLARATGLGQAILGAVFLGATSSLSGAITSVSAAWSGHPELAFGNAIGGIAAQTVFLVIADLVYRRANLEHAAASEANLMQGVLLVALLAIPLLGMFWPPLTLWGIDLVSLAIVVTYAFGIRLISRAHALPMWLPRQTKDTQKPERDGSTATDSAALRRLWLSFALLAALVAACGWVVARAGLAIVAQTGLSESLVGNLFTSVATSLPELVIAVAAVRRGALTLAVGDIVGGNAYDVLFLAGADIAYRGGSIYHAVSTTQAAWLALNILLTAILLMGLLRRERHGIANIGFEGVLILGLYLLAVGTLFAGG